MCEQFVNLLVLHAVFNLNVLYCNLNRLNIVFWSLLVLFMFYFLLIIVF